MNTLTLRMIRRVKELRERCRDGEYIRLTLLLMRLRMRYFRRCGSASPI